MDAISVWFRPGVLVDQQQHRKLRRGELQRGHAAQEILEHLELGALEHVAELLGQLAELERLRNVLGRILADLGQLRGLVGGFGNGHRLSLVIHSFGHDTFGKALRTCPHHALDSGLGVAPPLRLYLIIVVDHIKYGQRFSMAIGDDPPPKRDRPGLRGERPVLNTTIMLFLVQDGITNGAIYALLGLALVLVFAVTRVILIPQGEFVTYGALTYASLALRPDAGHGKAGARHGHGRLRARPVRQPQGAARRRVIRSFLANIVLPAVVLAVTLSLRRRSRRSRSASSCRLSSPR